MDFDTAKQHVQYVVDDALNGGKVGPNRRVRTHRSRTYKYSSVLVGWELDGSWLFVAVHSYLDVPLNDAEAADYAGEYVNEIRGINHAPDLIIRCPFRKDRQ